MRNNSATVGGGIFNGNGTATLTDVTLSGNPASNAGGGINNAGTITLTNVTLSGNSALGGGIYNFGTASLLNTTMVSNSATSAGNVGGILNFGVSHLSLKNVIVETSTNGNCGFLTAPDSSLFNLSSDSTCAFGAGRDNVLNINLGPLADNGGPTLTHMPQSDSAAIDNGTGAGCPATDQRGAPRPAGAACDVGSVEYGSNPPATTTPIPTPTPSPSPTPMATLSPTPSLSPSPTPTTTNTPHKQGDLNCDGAIDGRDALRPLRAAAGVPLTPPGGCLDLGFGSSKFGDVNCDGNVDVGDTVAILEYAAGVPITPPQQAGCAPLGSLLS